MIKQLRKELNGHTRSFTLGQLLTFLQICVILVPAYITLKGTLVEAAEDFIIEIADEKLVGPVKDELSELKGQITNNTKAVDDLSKDVQNLKASQDQTNQKLDMIIRSLPASQ